MTAISMLEQKAVTEHRNRSKFELYQRLLACVIRFDLEEAVRISRRHRLMLDPRDLDPVRKRVADAKATAHTGAERLEFELKIDALNRIRCHGLIPEKIVQQAVLPEYYNGKILMAAVTGGEFDSFAILRSGDLWHREILQNTRKEINMLGFRSADVYPMGGAYAKFEDDGRIVLYGTSDDYGVCDKKDAAQLINAVYPDRKIVVTG